MSINTYRMVYSEWVDSQEKQLCQFSFLPVFATGVTLEGRGFLFNPLYICKLFQRYMLDKFIFHFGVMSLFPLFYSIFDWKTV